MVTGPCTWLLGALILLLVVYPIAGESLNWMLLIGVLNSAVLIAGALASSRTRRTVIIAFSLALPALALQWKWVISRDQDSGFLFIATLLAFYVFAIGHVVAYVLSPSPVTGNKMHGAISAYIMIGLFWAFLCKVLEVLVPGSFVNLVEHNLQHPLEWRQFVFFSFTTLTTTGYGDIVPVKGHAQSAAILEQLAEILYVAILIARLAGLYQPGSGGRSHGKTCEKFKESVSSWPGLGVERWRRECPISDPIPDVQVRSRGWLIWVVSSTGRPRRQFPARNSPLQPASTTTT